MAQDDIRTELKRKRIHYVGLIVPLSYIVLSKIELLGFVGLSLVGFCILDYFRLKKKNRLINTFFNEEEEVITSIRLKPINGIGVDLQKAVTIPTFKPLLRHEEKTNIGAHIYFALGAFISILLFPKNIAMASIIVLVVGDSLAAIFGKLFGKHKIYRKKTEVGTLTCFAASFIICYIFVPLEIALLGAFAAAISELFSGERLNDNVTIPIVSGGVMMLAEIILNNGSF